MIGLGLGLGFSQSVPPFVPTSLGSGLKLWLRADLGITIATGVSVWADQSGNGNNASQGTGALQPSLNATDASYANKPTVQAAATQFMKTVALAIAQPLTVVLVGEFSTGSGAVIATSASSATDPIIWKTGGNVAINAGSTLGSTVAAGTPGATLAAFNDTSSFVGVSNWLSGGVSGAAGNGPATLVSLFAYSTGDYGSIGKIAELLVLNRLLTSPEKSSLAGYITARYGIAIT